MLSLRRPSFRLGWLAAYPMETRICTCEVVALIARQICLWSLNACRIIYQMDEPGPVRCCALSAEISVARALIRAAERRQSIAWRVNARRVRGRPRAASP
jgi:hypothetical protein